MQLTLFESEKYSVKKKMNYKDVTAIFALYFGNHLSSEYVHFGYEKVFYNPTKKEYLFAPEVDDKVSSRRPTLRLTELSNGNLEGKFYGYRYGLIGDVKLEPSENFTFKEITPDKVIYPLYGKYTGSCPAKDKTAKMKEVFIFPSRVLTPDALVSESLTANINYVGGAVCDTAAYQNQTCLNFFSGSHDFFKSQLHLYVSNNYIFECNILSDRKLNCSSDRFQNCEFEKERRVRHSVQPIERVLERKIQYATPQVTTPCQGWEGVYWAKLHHRLLQKDQIVSFQFWSFELPNPDGNDLCKVRGQASLYFGPKPISEESIQYTFKEQDFTVAPSDTIFVSLPNEDLIVRITEKDKKKIKGFWYSKMFGEVGSFEGSEAEIKKIDNPVMGLSGKFRWTHNRKWGLEIVNSQSGSFVESFNPYAPVHLSGWHIFDGTLGHVQFPARDQIQSFSYDYFTNHILFRTSSLIMSGKIIDPGMSFQVMTKTYLGNIPAADQNRIYERQ